ncbi:PhzF family phenazine biosynthesis protein [Paracraurococcus lichenis]|uniref:PhzF family phenazine biosynthesis protein n=1 Tax=Paracraurococcus lichenis TaxID=3064888 RepID=A0ABT9DV76_9PROT|nr:PhzF family phenazine biosynthesis protein [Paracraurococcus sp. LOR1-02]MDO9707802.1 PhzF family phenazine biosynthesis protein [Paracraurococcus sp. LOR1-02]
MRSHPFVTLDVFTARRFGGNQLAVFPDAQGIGDAEMQALATEFNLSETTFVLPPADPANTARVRIFNRVAEMPFAGHPSVGTAVVLAQRGHGAEGRLRLEMIAGIVEVELWRDADGRPAGAAIGAPQPLSVGAALPVAPIAACAGLAPEGIVTVRHAPTLAADGGNPRVLVEVTEAALAAARPEFGAFRQAVEALPELGGRLSLYLYRRDGAGLRARMFSPLTGTWEDPATGSAATPLAGFLLHLSGAESASLDILQGVEMGRPSLLRTTARRTPEGIRATVGGFCVPVLRGEALL